MNFGQAFAALLSGRSITRAGWNHPGMQLGMQAPTGKVTQPFITIHLANGEVGVWCPDQSDILANDWNAVGQEKGAAHAGSAREHAGVVG